MATAGIFFTLIFMLLFYFLIGRGLATHTLPKRAFAASGLFNIFTAIGLWMLFTLVALNISAPLHIAWIAFIIITLIGWLYLWTLDTDKLDTELTLVLPTLILIFLIPTLYFISGDTPKEAIEWLTHIRQGNFLAETSTLPNAENVYTQAFAQGLEPQGLTLLMAPFSLIYGEVAYASFAILNAFILAFVADALIKVTPLNVRWSNVALVAVGSILALTFLNPLFTLSDLNSASSNIAFAACFFVSIIPLCRNKDIPVGLGALPIAFCLCALTMLHVIGAYIAGFVIAMYIYRLMLEEHEVPHSIFTVTALIALPFSAYQLWSYYIENNTWLPELTTPSIGQLLTGLTTIPLELSIVMTGVLILYFTHSNHSSEASFKQRIQEKSWLVIPTLAVLFYVYLSIAIPQRAEISHLQFVAMIPFWHFATSWYKQSKYRTLAFEAPWAIALTIAIIFIAFQSIASNNLTHRMNDHERFVETFSNRIGNNLLREGENIAILDEGNTANLTTAMARYHLSNHKGKVIDVNDMAKSSLANADLFHIKLKNEKFGFLWILNPSAQTQQMLPNTRAGQSILFEINQNSFKLIN